MLLRFGVSNHRSIRDYQQIAFTASSLKDAESGLIWPNGESEDEIPKKRKLRVVPVVSIYGANAAGKSNLLKALQFYTKAIVRSQERSQSGTPYHPFGLDDESSKLPSQYDADFIVGKARYHYGFTLDGESILSEWLYTYPINARRQTRTVLFHRDSSLDDEFYFGKVLKGENRVISKLTRPNALFLSTAAQNSHPQLSAIYDFFRDRISFQMQSSDPNPVQLARDAYSYFGHDEEMRDKVASFLKSADVGISSIEFAKMQMNDSVKSMLGDFQQVITKYVDGDVDFSDFEPRQIEFIHSGLNGKGYRLSLDNESSGTTALISMLGPIFSRLIVGGILIVDELNTCLHPLISRQLIKLFSCPDTNPGGAQLIFSTHDTSMLVTGLMRRDQIWFAEKDTTGSTVYYSLSDIKVRASDNFEKGYIEGRFGAIPVFGLASSNCRQIGIASELKD